MLIQMKNIQYAYKRIFINIKMANVDFNHQNARRILCSN